MTRRELAASLLAAPALAQAPAPKPDTPEQLLADARSQFQQGADAMKKVPLPMAVEPAAVFRA